MSDLLQSNKEGLGAWHPYTLRYRDTDVLRYAAASMRAVQSLSSLARRASRVPDSSRREIDVVELLYALHRWRRQVHIVAAYIRLMENTARGMPLGDGCALRLPHAALRSLAKPATPELSGPDLVKHLLLKQAPDDEVTSSKVARAPLKDCQAMSKDNKTTFLLASVKDAISSLAEIPLVTLELQPGERPSDRRVCWFEKLLWRDLTPTVRSDAKRLQSEDVFL